MIRRLFSLASALSALLCAATVVLWVRSYWKYEGVGSPTRNGWSYELGSERGEIEVSVAHWLAPIPNPDWTYIGTPLSPVMGSPWGPERTFGFRSGRSLSLQEGSSAPFAEGRFIVLSDWLLVLATAILPGLWLLHGCIQRGLHRVGSCPDCGYDLRATPDRCPECGVAAEGTR